MNPRWPGLVLLLISLILSTLTVNNVKITTYQRKEGYVEAIEDGTRTPIIDRVVWVPPWNDTTRGWVGFDAILQQGERADYEAYGLIMPNDNDTTPNIALRAVNTTGLANLLWDQWDPSTWANTKVYAEADLLSYRLYAIFTFHDLDSSANYTILFRNYKNETSDRPILINIKEAWNDRVATPLLEPTAPNFVFISLIAVVALGLMIKKPSSTGKRRLQRRNYKALSTTQIAEKLQSR